MTVASIRGITGPSSANKKMGQGWPIRYLPPLPKLFPLGYFPGTFSSTSPAWTWLLASARRRAILTSIQQHGRWILVDSKFCIRQGSFSKEALARPQTLQAQGTLMDHNSLQPATGQRRISL